MDVLLVVLGVSIIAGMVAVASTLSVLIRSSYRTKPEKTHEERLAALESLGKRLQLEWNETYERINRLMGRIAKKTALDAPGSIPEPSNDPSYDPKLHLRGLANRQDLLARFGGNRAK